MLKSRRKFVNEFVQTKGARLKSVKNIKELYSADSVINIEERAVAL